MRALFIEHGLDERAQLLREVGKIAYVLALNWLVARLSLIHI